MHDSVETIQNVPDTNTSFSAYRLPHSKKKIFQKRKKIKKKKLAGDLITITPGLERSGEGAHAALLSEGSGAGDFWDEIGLRSGDSSRQVFW
jgi:hypothetical protein